jgi:uncharacterized BrkB/YihY/UPF0761 family membrane protein
MAEQSSQHKHVTVADWVVFMCLMTLPIVNIVLPFYEAFGSDRNPSKQNFCRAYLILMVLSWVCVIAIIVLFGAAFSALLGDMDFSQMPELQNLPNMEELMKMQQMPVQQPVQQ